MENGGLAIHPLTGELWVVEAFGIGGPASIFKVDASTGLAIPPVIPLGFGGQPGTIGFDALEILADGRFVATSWRLQGGIPSIFEIDPVPSQSSGLAEFKQLPFEFDPAIAGTMNGLTDSPALAASIDFRGELSTVFEDNGSAIYSGGSVGTEFFGEFRGTGSSAISDGTRITPFDLFHNGEAFFEVTNDLMLDAEDASFVNSLAGTDLVVGDVIDVIEIFGGADTSTGGQIEIALIDVLDSSAFDDESPDNYPAELNDVLARFFYVEETRDSGSSAAFDTFGNLGPLSGSAFGEDGDQDEIIFAAGGLLDSDGDGILDDQDNCPYSINEDQVDTDSDGLGDTCDADDDGDGMPDDFELANGFEPLDPDDANEDADNDGLTNLDEFLGGTLPHNPDSDGDTAPDGVDAFPNDSGESVDTDGDGIGNNADPDDDGDGMPDNYETDNGLDPLNKRDAYDDADGDGHNNRKEFRAGTDPNDANSEPPFDSLPYIPLLLDQVN